MLQSGLETVRQTLLSSWAISREQRDSYLPAVPSWGQPAQWRRTRPAHDQELLLKAALLRDERGLRAWRELRPRLDFDALDDASWPVLPVLHRNLIALDALDGDDARLRGIRRYLWAQNQLLLGEVMPLVGLLEKSDVPTTVLKGGALMPLLEDPGMRPVRDIDVLVPEHDWARAMDLLTGAGLMPIGGFHRTWIEGVLQASVGSHGLITPGGRQLDLHRHAMHQSRHADADADLWAATRHVEIAGVKTRVPDLADQLIHTICHAMWWDMRPSYRWVIDGSLLLREGIDFDRVLIQARKRRLTVPVREGLAYLKQEFGAAVPTELIHALGEQGGGLLERTELQARLRPAHEHTLFDRAVLAHQSRIRRLVDPGDGLSAARHVRLALEGLRGDESDLRSRHPVRLGETIRLGRSHAPGRYVVRGMGIPEASGCWTVGREARFAVPLTEPPERSTVLRVSGGPFVHPARPFQRLAVVANGIGVASWRATAVDSVSEQAAVLPASVWRRRGALDLRLRTPDAHSPMAFGVSEDIRQLGWFITELTISAPERYELGTELHFGADGNAERYLAGGWWPGETQGRWTAGNASLLLALDRPATSMKLAVEGTLSGEQPTSTVTVAVAINGRRHSSVRVVAQRPELSLELPVDGVAANDLLEVRLGISPRSLPSARRTSDDVRQLGLKVHRCVLQAAP